jgi:DNA-binding FadR family transcriptional regulator
MQRWIVLPSASRVESAGRLGGLDGEGEIVSKPRAGPDTAGLGAAGLGGGAGAGASVNRAGVIRAQRIPEQVAADIRKRIMRGQIGATEALPAETELMAQYGVSRPTLREALRILEAQRFVVVRRGGIGGALVQRPSLDLAARQFGFVLQDRGVTMADVHRARALIEPPALSALAATILPEELEELAALLRDAQAFIGDAPLYSHAAETIRERMVEMTGASTVALLMRMLREVVERHTAATGSVAPDRWAKLQKLSLRAHQRLVELIGQGERAQAEAFWREHLAKVQDHLGPVAATRVIDVLE